MRFDIARIEESGPYFIAEAGVNHNGSLDMAEELVETAVEAGADAVKFQTYNADRLVTKSAEKVDYQQGSAGSETQYQMLERYEMDRAAHEHLKDLCEDLDIAFLSTPFDVESAAMLAEIGVPALKIGSGELDNHPLLENVAGLGLPMIVSTGMGTLQEVVAARDVIRGVDGDLDLVFLHCTSTYPCDVRDVNLRAMASMDEELAEPVGYSDHTIRPETPSLAVAAGAHVVEKHFTLDATLPGPDHGASLEPDELAEAVELVDYAAEALGNRRKEPTESELANKSTVRKSLHAARDLPAGTTLTADHIDILRPANGLSPMLYGQVLGSKVSMDLETGEPITAADVDVDFEHASDS